MKIQVVQSIDVLPSTNDYIRQNLNILTSGVCIRALKQTHGKGRRGNVWTTDSKLNLTFSFLVTANTHLSNDIFMASALALKSVLKDYFIDASIKLPNDIYVGNKKIAGMLIETLKTNDKVQHICGIGLNINEQNPLKYDQNATSMLFEQTHLYEIEKILNKFVERYNHYVVLKDTFKEFKSALFERKHVAIYQGKRYQLTAISEAFMCTITQGADKQVISCDQLTFALN